MILTSVDKTLVCNIQLKTIKKYFYVVLFIMLYKGILSYKSVNETLVSEHLNGSFNVVQFKY